MSLKSLPNALKRQYFYRAHFTKRKTVYDRLCLYDFFCSHALSMETRNFHALAKVIAQCLEMFHTVDKDVTLHSDFKHNQIHEGRRKGTKGKI